jgi:iron complex outermembrane receptor protein
MKKLLVSVSLTAFAFAAAPASAADAASSEVDDVITVTAQKREQSLQDVPFSLDVLSGDELETISAGGEDILFLSARTPSVYAEGSFGRTFPRFYIRGLGNTDFDLNANQPVSLVYDEGGVENPTLKGFPVFDLDRVEVLRGPQGTLFGRNTPAGVIKFESAKPTREAEGYGRIAYGRFETVDAEGAVSGPLSDTVSARLSALYQSRGDVVDNVSPLETRSSGTPGAFEAFDEFAARLQLLFEPSDALSILFNVHGRDLDGGSRTFRANAIAPGGGLIAGFDRLEAAQDAVQNLNVENLGASLRVEADRGYGVITSITAWESVRLDARGDVDGGFGAVFAPPSGPGFIPFSAETADNITGHDQFTQELRLAFNPRADVEATLGFFGFYEELELENISYDTLAGSVENAFGTQNQETTALALFGAASWAASERLTVSGGLRISVEEREFQAERLLGPFGAPPLGPLEESLDDTALTGDFSLDYALSEELSVYGRYARGFRAPNAQGRILFGDFVTVADTETIDSLEAGFKRTLPDGLGYFNGAAFVFATQDQQLTAVGGAGNFNQLLNADSVKGWGLEFDAGLRPAERIELTAGLSYNSTEIDDADLEVGVCGAPCTVLDPINAATGNALIDGNPLPQAPEWIANATARYGHPVRGGLGELFLLADIAYRSEINLFLYESAEFQSDGMTEVGLRGGYVHDDGRWEIAAYGRNIFDETAIEGAVDFNNFTAFINEPPLWGVELLARY